MIRGSQSHPFLCRLWAPRIPDVALSRPRPSREASIHQNPEGWEGLLVTGGHVQDSQLLCSNLALLGLLAPKMAEEAGPWLPNGDGPLAHMGPANMSLLGQRLPATQEKDS